MDLSAALAPSANAPTAERRGANQPRQGAASFGPIMERATAAADAKSGSPTPASRPANERPAATQAKQPADAADPRPDAPGNTPTASATDAPADRPPQDAAATDTATSDTPPAAPPLAPPLPLPAPGSEAAALPAWLMLAATAAPQAPTEDAPTPSLPGASAAAPPATLHPLTAQAAVITADREPDAALPAAPLIAAPELAAATPGHAPQAAAAAPVAPAAAGVPALNLPPAVAAATTPPLHAAPGQPAFAHELGERILVLGHGPVKSAQIALNPAELGPVEVRLELRGQDASLVLNAAHATTRAALEDSLPRLREMFAAQGLSLGNAEVGAQTRDSSGQPGNGPRQQTAAGEGGKTDSPFEEGLRAPARSLRGLVDTFA